MEKQDYLFRCSVAPRNFPLDRTTQKVVKVVTSQPDFPETFLHMVNNKRLARFSIPFLRRNLSWEFKLGVSNTERRKQLLRGGYLSPHSRFKIE